jgi:hypothetical protein
MAPFRRGTKASTKGSSGDPRRDALALLIAYVKQETLDPLKSLGRFVLFGVTGSIAIAIGTGLLLLAGLRALQTETGTFHGNLSWVPYLIVAAAALAVIGLSAWRIVSGPATRRIPAKKKSD